jgi:Protein of unknown function (DUF2442)
MWYAGGHEVFLEINDYESYFTSSTRIPVFLLLKKLKTSLRYMTMNLQVLSKPTLEVEITHISKHGLWILIDHQEWFLSYEDFPWFQSASVKSILNVETVTPEHLYWPDLDIDLSIESIKHPERFPLKAS